MESLMRTVIAAEGISFKKSTWYKKLLFTSPSREKDFSRQYSYYISFFEKINFTICDGHFCVVVLLWFKHPISC